MNRVHKKSVFPSYQLSTIGHPQLRKEGNSIEGGAVRSLLYSDPVLQNDDEMIEFHPYMGLLAHSRVSVAH